MLVKTLGELQRSLDIGANSLGTVAVRAGEEKRDIQTWDRLSAPSSKSPRAARRERQAPAPELDSDEEVEALTRSHLDGAPTGSTVRDGRPGSAALRDGVVPDVAAAFVAL